MNEKEMMDFFKDVILYRKNRDNLGFIAKYVGGDKVVEFDNLEPRYEKALRKLAQRIVSVALVLLRESVGVTYANGTDDQQAETAKMNAMIEKNLAAGIDLLLSEKASAFVTFAIKMSDILRMSYHLGQLRIEGNQWVLDNSAWDGIRFKQHSNDYTLNEAWRVLLRGRQPDNMRVVTLIECQRMKSILDILTFQDGHWAMPDGSYWNGSHWVYMEYGELRDPLDDAWYEILGPDYRSIRSAIDEEK